jgi:hypothetical protein
MAIIKYYILYDELFDVIQNIHVTLEHRCVRYTLNEIKKKYINITEKQVRPKQSKMRK